MKSDLKQAIDLLKAHAIFVDEINNVDEKICGRYWFFGWHKNWRWNCTEKIVENRRTVTIILDLDQIEAHP